MSVYSLRICAVSLPRVYLNFNKHSSVSRSGLDLEHIFLICVVSFLTFDFSRAVGVCPLTSRTLLKLKIAVRKVR